VIALPRQEGQTQKKPILLVLLASFVSQVGQKSMQTSRFTASR
jgi:hypothetical protein